MADAPGQLEISLHVPLADPLPGGKPSRVLPTSKTWCDIQELGWVLRGQPPATTPGHTGFWYRHSAGRPVNTTICPHCQKKNCQTQGRHNPTRMLCLSRGRNSTCLRILPRLRASASTLGCSFLWHQASLI